MTFVNGRAFDLPVTSIAFRSASSAAVVSRRARRLARTASTEKRLPSGRKAVHSASSPSIQSPPFSRKVMPMLSEAFRAIEG